jgi:hypothetical protein
VVLQPPELALDGGAAAVEAAPLVALGRDARLPVGGVLAEGQLRLTFFKALKATRRAKGYFANPS